MCTKVGPTLHAVIVNLNHKIVTLASDQYVLTHLEPFRSCKRRFLG